MVLPSVFLPGGDFEANIAYGDHTIVDGHVDATGDNVGRLVVRWCFERAFALDLRRSCGVFNVSAIDKPNRFVIFVIK